MKELRKTLRDISKNIGNIDETANLDVICVLIDEMEEKAKLTYKTIMSHVIKIRGKITEEKKRRYEIQNRQ